MNSFHNPATLARPNGFSHVAKSTCRTTIIVSGQVSYDSQGGIVGRGDLGAQTTQVYRNIQAALESSGASMRDLVKTTLYVKGLSPDKALAIREARAPFLAADNPPASTMVGVESLAHPDLLLEVEATAMIGEG